MDELRETCTLSDEELAARRLRLREELAPHVRGRRVLADGVELTFEASAERRRDLEAFVAFERGCCPGLGFGLREEQGSLRLAIHGLDPRASVLAMPAPARQGRQVAQASRGARIARAGGLGAIGAFVLLCGVPLAVAALAGAAVAAPLGVLDHPLALGLGALVLAAGAWRWERNRARRPGTCGG
jgi:hypothetical protein